jgi:cell division septum initiation protein DivIVA
VIKKGDKLPLTKKILVNPDYILNLIAELEEVLPFQLEEAEEILDEKKEIINNAEQKAELEIERMISETAVMKEAEQEAKKIVRDAKVVANEIRTGIDEYADEILAEVESDLQQKLSEIKKNRAELRTREREVE